MISKCHKKTIIVSTELLPVLCKMNPTTASLLLLVLLCANPQAEADRLLNSYNKLRKKSGTWKDSSRYMLALTLVVELTFFSPHPLVMPFKQPQMQAWDKPG